MPEHTDTYLDIETTRAGGISVIGFESQALGLVQLWGPDVTAEKLLAALPAGGRLFTFNGHGFDLPLIRARLGVNLMTRHHCNDLMLVCRGRGLRGGQKAIEERIRFHRETKGIRGFHALGLWERWEEDNDRRALDLLLQYNAEDVRGMVAIHNFLDAYFLFPNV